MLFDVGFDLLFDQSPDRYHRLKATLRALGGRERLQTNWRVPYGGSDVELAGYIRVAGEMNAWDRLTVDPVIRLGVEQNPIESEAPRPLPLALGMSPTQYQHAMKILSSPSKEWPWPDSSLRRRVDRVGNY
jgi:hypothetical protein